MRLTLGIWALAVALLIRAPAAAHAYPQFQLSTLNSRCQNCHFSPVGGGLINEYGRSEAGDTISMGGDGSFLHGLWDEPDWVQFGADLRYAMLFKDVGDDPRFNHFPMQGDTYVRFAFGVFSTYLNIGPRAAAREPRQSALRRMVSREHFITWQPDESGFYVRAGRFLAPFGLRQADHTVYTRKFTGFHVLEETYNASGGYFGSDWELHLTAFMPADPFTADSPKEKGLVAYGETSMLGDNIVVGGQLRWGAGGPSSRYTAGAVAKWYLPVPSLLLLGELDFIHQTFEADSSPARTQLASYLGLTYFPVRGVMVTGAYEKFDNDLDISATFRDGYRLDVQVFPWAHWELHLFGKVEVQGEYEDPGYTAMLMGHYYL